MAKSLSYLYLISNQERTLFKLGCSRYPSARLRQLQTGNSSKLTLLAICPGNYKQERALHIFLCTTRLQGEWFSYSSKLDLILERWQSKSL